jgi:endonuclease/exonuclease/phosphatase family metal-dependent hydrolase
MKCVSYNIQYGVGLDGNYDLARIAEAVRGADVIALQEVTRHNPRNGGRDMVAELRDLLPGHFAVYGSNFEADIGSSLESGKAIDRHFSLGNMILSKTPIRSSRNILLPRRRSIGKTNYQRGALEAMVDTPFGPIRFYSTHLDHRGPDERLAQVRHILERVLAYPSEGGALTGVAEFGLPEPVRSESAIVLGDFNMLEGSPEYVAVTGTVDHEFGLPLVGDRLVDAAAALGVFDHTCVSMDDPDNAASHKRIDYAFLTADLASRLKSCRVDKDAKGSDHLPLWIELA